MKKYFYKIFFTCIFTGTLYAQQQINTEFKTKILQVFQNLDKNRVPHGILLDFGMEFTNLQAFNGTLTDSTYTNSQTLSDIYKTLLMCRVRSNVTTGFITPQEYASHWYSQRTQGVITLSGQYFKYNRFADNAYPSKLNYTNNQFSDKFIGSVWQNPYEEKQLFAMTTSVSNYKGLNLQVKLPANLFLTNYPATVQNIQVDFSDGIGYRNIAYDQLLNVNYSQANTYTWKYKITLTNGQTLLSHSKIEIEEGLNAIPYTNQISTLVPQAATTTSNLSAYQKITITSTTPYGSGPFAYGSATVYIKYKTGGNTITKPLIIAEGFDTGVILTPEQEAGDNNIEYFLRDINRSDSSLPFETNQYDIIYVDWNNGVDFIQKNAYVLEEVIKWVNTQKANNGSTLQNVVLGQSMGGLIARYALRDIELNRGFNHDTRLYVSHDAPHLGANTPLSVQYSARHLRNMYIQTPLAFTAGDIILPLIQDFAQGFSQIINFFGGNTSSDSDLANQITPLQAFSLADVPAARQMQYNWVNRSYGINNVIHNAWQQELATLGYPIGYPAQGKPIRNIAIANGSECGVIQPIYSNIVSYIKDAGRNTLISNYIGVLDSFYASLINQPQIMLVSSLFPGKSYWQVDFQSKYMTNRNENKNIYHGSIKYKKKIFWFIPVSITVTEKDVNQSSGILPYDIYGGGSQTPPVSEVPLNGIITNSFGFIPTASALDIGMGTTVINDNDYRKSYVGALPPVLPKNSPFQNFVTHFDQFNPNNNNSRHISFNRRNGNWLRSELNLSIADEYSNCSVFCLNAQITGSTVLCTTGVYSVTSEADPADTIWSISEGSSLVTMSVSGNQVTITQVNPNSSGYITLNATYSNSKCGTASVPKRIWVGRPNVQDQNIYGGYDNVPKNTQSTFSVTPVPGASQYYWFIYNASTTCGCTTDSSGLTICPTGTILPKFSSNGLSTLTSSSTAATVNWGNCTGTYVVNCIAKNSCGEVGISHKIVTVFGTSSGGGGGGSNPCEGELLVYPNPINKNGGSGDISVNIAYPGDPCNNINSLKTNSTNQIVIYDFYGNKVYSNQYATDEFSINGIDLKRGHYILNVFTSKGFTKKEIIVVE